MRPTFPSEPRRARVFGAPAPFWYQTGVMRIRALKPRHRLFRDVRTVPGSVGCLSDLAARGKRLAAFDGRCIPGGCVAPPSNTAGILSRRALPAGRLARLGATPAFHHGPLDLAHVPAYPGAGHDRLPVGIVDYCPRPEALIYNTRTSG